MFVQRPSPHVTRRCSSVTNKQTEHIDKAARPTPAALRQAAVHRVLTVKNHMHCNTRGSVLRESVFYNNLNVRAWDAMCHLGVYGNNGSGLGQFLRVNCGYNIYIYIIIYINEPEWKKKKINHWVRAVFSFEVPQNDVAWAVLVVSFQVEAVINILRLKLVCGSDKGVLIRLEGHR